MTTPPTAMTTPEPLQIKLSAQQRREFTMCAQMCGLELAAWIVQCADVKAADAIDAMQATQRVERPSRKPQKPRLRAESPTVEIPIKGTGVRDPAVKSSPPPRTPAKSPGQNSAVESIAPQGATGPKVRSTSSKDGTSTGAENSAPKRARSSGTEGASPKKAPSSETSGPKKATLRAARSYNERFRRKIGASAEQRDEGVR